MRRAYRAPQLSGSSDLIEPERRTMVKRESGGRAGANSDDGD